MSPEPFVIGSVENSDAQGDEAAVDPGAPVGASRGYLWLELLTMFAVAPVLYWYFLRTSRMVFPALWLWALVCLVLLLKDKRFERRRLGWRSVGRREVGAMMVLWFALGLVLWTVAFVINGLLYWLQRRTK